MLTIKREIFFDIPNGKKIKLNYKNGKFFIITKLPSIFYKFLFLKKKTSSWSGQLQPRKSRCGMGQRIWPPPIVANLKNKTLFLKVLPPSTVELAGAFRFLTEANRLNRL